MVGHEDDSNNTANPYDSPKAPSEHVDRSPPTGFSWGTASLGCGVAVFLVLSLVPSEETPRGSARRAQCANNLKQIGYALQAYHAQYESFPPAYTVDASGNRLHSWRTLLLPHLENQALYDTIDFSKPWNDPANAQAYAKFPAILRCPAEGQTPPKCIYLALVAPGSFLKATQGVTMESNREGPDRILVIEAPVDRGVHWMEPVDADDTLLFAINKKSKLAHTGGFYVLLCDGNVRFLTSDTPAVERRQGITGIKDTTGTEE